MLVPAQYAGFAQAEEVNGLALIAVEKEGAGEDGGCLWYLGEGERC